MRTFKVTLLAALVAAGTVACGAGAGTSSADGPELAEGAAGPEQAVEIFIDAAGEAVRARRDGELNQADRAYERMAAVFGTEQGSITRSRSSDDVRSRMIVLAACLRPDSFRILSTMDPAARRMGRTSVTVELTRNGEATTLPFHLIRGPDERWFIERIDVSSFAC